MASTSPPRSAASSPSSPLLPSPDRRAAANGGSDLSRRLPSLRGAARFLRRTGSRRIMREPSVAVRETAAEHLEERRTDWAYSKPVVVLDVLWNLAFVAVAAAVLAASLAERPAVPLRLWLVGYVLQCLLHVLCVAVEYKRRRLDRDDGTGAEQDGAGDGDFKLSQQRDLTLGLPGVPPEHAPSLDLPELDPAAWLSIPTNRQEMPPLPKKSRTKSQAADAKNQESATAAPRKARVRGRRWRGSVGLAPSVVA